MKEHAQEQKQTAARRGSRAEKEAAAERDVLAKIAEMPEADRVLAERIHAIVKAAAPDLTPKLWYGMPAYARDGKIICHFQSAQKFKSRYATLGFSDQAALDDGAMWPTAYALKELTAADEQRISTLVKKAVG
ncbi:iron chaperone [Streptomyces sp. NPDC001292]|uniref:iron chaperone n=1 Tax=Streptomyces sp. NPDC001292 TaxID=3364558 RepID=UPI0036C04C59